MGQCKASIPVLSCQCIFIVFQSEEYDQSVYSFVKLTVCMNFRGYVNCGNVKRPHIFYCMLGSACTIVHTWRSKDACESCPPLSTIQDAGITFRRSGLVRAPLSAEPSCRPCSMSF